MAVDFETSSRESWGTCAIGMARIADGEIEDCFYSLVRPPSSNVLYTHVHGLTWDMLRDAPTFAEIWPQISEVTAGARYFVAHNASFDSRVLDGCCRFAGLIAPDVSFLCTLKGARAALDIPSKSLASVCSHLNIGLEHHNAYSDARACAEIYLRLLAMGLEEKRMLLGRGQARAYSK